jgi:hypothetical protein
MAKDRSPKDAAEKKPGRVAKVRQVFTAAQAVDQQIGWWMALAFLGVLALVVIIGVLTHFLVFSIILGIALAALAATIVLSQRAERAAYRQIEGQPGAVGRPGIVLIGEGPSGRAQRLLAAERRRVERVAPGVPVVLLRVGTGDGEGEVGIRKLTNTVRKLKPVLTKDEVSVVNKRLRALGGIRPPLPKGVDPTKARMDRRATRGR